MMDKVLKNLEKAGEFNQTFRSRLPKNAINVS